jgi:hypothetical protein
MQQYSWNNCWKTMPVVSSPVGGESSQANQAGPKPEIFLTHLQSSIQLGDMVQAGLAILFLFHQ